jgi:transglutaminase-like putative cysteine protease
MSPCLPLKITILSALLAVFMVLPHAAHAIGFQPISPDELKMTAEPKAPGADAIILHRQLDRVDGRVSHEDNYFRIKILKEEGRKHADIEIIYDKDKESIVNLHARTIRPDGTVAEFTGKPFDKTIIKGQNIGYLAKTFTLPEVQPRSIIEYYYTIDYSDSWVFNSSWVISSELFTKSARFTLDPYNRFRLDWTWYGLAEGPKQEKPGGMIHMEVRDIPAFQREELMPPEDDLKAHVLFVYSTSTVVENDTVKFWKQADKEFNDRVENFAGKKKSDMERAVAEIVTPTDSPDVKAQKIYARVQQFRNTSYAEYKTEEERKRDKEKDINNVDDVWKQGFGDSEQLTWLYLALVRAAGIEAHGVLVASRATHFFNASLRNRYDLNANLVQLHFKDKDVYCDPGTAYMPYGMLPWQESGVRGLRLDKDGGQWVDTPVFNSNVSQIIRKATFKLTEEGTLEGKLRVTYTGLEASARRTEERKSDDVAHKRFLEDEVREFVPVGIEVELVNNPDWRSSSNELTAEFDLRIPGWAEGAGRRVMLPIGIFGAREKNVFAHSNRVYAIFYSHPSGKIDDIKIELPDGWHVASVPPSAGRDEKIIAYSTAVEKNGTAIHISRRFTTDITGLDTKYYPALQEFYRMMRTSDEQQIVLQPGTATAAR